MFSFFTGLVRTQSSELFLFSVQRIVYLRLLFHSLPSRKVILRNDALGCHLSISVQFKGCPPVTLALVNSKQLSVLEGQLLVRAGLEGPQRRVYLTVRRVYLTVGLRRNLCLKFVSFCTCFNFSLRRVEKSFAKRLQTWARTAPVLEHFIWMWIYDCNRFRTDETRKLDGSSIGKCESWEEQSYNNSCKTGLDFFDSVCTQECCLGVAQRVLRRDQSGTKPLRATQ